MIANCDMCSQLSVGVSNRWLGPGGEGQERLTEEVRKARGGVGRVWRDRARNSPFLFRRYEALCQVSRTKKTPGPPCLPPWRPSGWDCNKWANRSINGIILSGNMCSEG